MTIDDDETLRRKATGAMIDLVLMHSPAQAALRDEGRHYDQLFAQLLASPEDAARLAEELSRSCDRLMKLIDIVGDHIDGGAP